MGRTKETPGVARYYKTLQRIFALQSEILTGVLPHAGERGRNDEERFRNFLIRVIPRKFSIGTGFVVCSDISVPASSQTDVVIYDEIHNSPLHRELSAFIYPIEIVYGVVEVKGLLQKKDIRKTIDDIRKIRKLSEHRWYIQYGSTPKSSNRLDQLVVAVNEFKVSTPPRTFVFAYEAKGWRKPEDLVKDLVEVTKKAPSHVHGLTVLNRDWYITQEAFAEGGPKFHIFIGDALLRFVNGLIHNISSVPMHQMSIDRYFKKSAGYA